MDVGVYYKFYQTMYYNPKIKWRLIFDDGQDLWIDEGL